MCRDLVESVRSQEHWLWDIARKRNDFLLFSIILRILQLFITLESLVQFRWGFQQNVPNEHSNQIENWKCHVWLQIDFTSHILIKKGCLSWFYLVWWTFRKNMSKSKNWPDQFYRKKLHLVMFEQICLLNLIWNSQFICMYKNIRFWAAFGG